MGGGCGFVGVSGFGSPSSLGAVTSMRPKICRGYWGCGVVGELMNLSSGDDGCYPVVMI